MQSLAPAHSQGKFEQDTGYLGIPGNMLCCFQVNLPASVTSMVKWLGTLSAPSTSSSQIHSSCKMIAAPWHKMKPKLFHSQASCICENLGH